MDDNVLYANTRLAESNAEFVEHAARPVRERKLELLAQLDRLAPPTAILASNTSSLSFASMAAI